jgi:hypothetical protein
MIISHKYKFIFIHCRKTAGSSISNALSEFLGPWDIQLSAIEETLMMKRPITLRMWANAYARSPIAVPASILRGRAIYSRRVATSIKRAWRSKLGEKPQHAGAAQIRKAFPDEWLSFHKFCVVRNPYDRAVSDYFWRTRDAKEKPSFETYLSALEAGDNIGGVVPIKSYLNWPKYTIDGRIAVDSVLRFETLQTDFARLLSDRGLALSSGLPSLKSKYRPNSTCDRPYRQHYSSRTRAMVERLYAPEIELFDYEF